MTGDIANRIREIIRQTCEMFEIEILHGVASKDYVYILVSSPPNMTPSEIIRRTKGRISTLVLEEFPHINNRYWGRHFWARGYLCVTS